jgi:CheY-like chemotaxis protein
MAELDLAGMRVLLVEDEALVTMLFEDALADLGCETVEVASRLADALDKARSLSFDVAILDVNLNGERTFAIAEALLTRQLPFVFATGYGTDSLPTPFQTVPIVHKPFRPSDLERALNAAIKATV